MEATDLLHPPMTHLVDSIGMVRSPQWPLAAARIGALDSQGAGTTIQGALDLKADASALAASGRLPLGGAEGGVLQKASAADFDVIWSLSLIHI